MADGFFENLKRHINEKLWEQIEVFNQVAEKLTALYYPKANQWAQAVTDVAKKAGAIEYKDLGNHQQITELNELKSGFENVKGDYAQQMIEKIDSDIASQISNGYLNYLVNAYGSLKSSFQEFIAFPLKQHIPLLSEVSSSLFVYIKLIEQQLTNLSGMLPKLIHAQTMIPAISSGKEIERENIGLWEKTKKRLSGSFVNNLIHFFSASIFDKIEQSTFNTKNFTHLFNLLHHNLPMQNLNHHAQNMTITNTPSNQLAVVAQQLENRFSISKLLNGAWVTILKKDEKRSDLFSPKQLTVALKDKDKEDLNFITNPEKMKVELTNKIASFCAELQSLLILLNDTSNTNFFNTLKMWHSVDKKSLPLCELVLKNLYDQLKHFVSMQPQFEIDNIHIEKCRVACEGVLKSIDMVTAGIALAQPFIDQTDFGNTSIKNILLTSELFLGLQAIDENIAFFDVLKEKIEIEVAPEIYAPQDSGLEQAGYRPKGNMQASGGKQKKALWSGFYTHSSHLYYLKHVTDYDFLADDLVEVIASNVATALGLGHRFAQCHHIRSKHNEVFVASLCTPGFKPIMNTEGRFTSRLTPTEKDALVQELNETEVAELSEILVLSLMLGDYDANVGNVGRTAKQGLVKIDHGWALEHICSSKQIVLQQELDPLRYLNRIAPTNNFNDYTKIMRTERFLNKVEELIKRFNKEKITITLSDTFKNFHTIYSGANIPKGVDKSIFSLFEYDQNISNFCFNRKFEYADIEKALKERVGITENLPPHSLAKKIAETFELRLHLLKIILLISLFKKSYSKKYQTADISPMMLIEKRFELRQKMKICFIDYFQSNLEFILPFLRTSDQESLVKILSDNTMTSLIDEQKSASSLIGIAAQKIQPKQEATLIGLNQLAKIYMQAQENQTSFAKALHEQPEIFFLNKDQHLPQNIISELFGHQAPDLVVKQLAESPYYNQLVVKLFLTRFKKELLRNDELDSDQEQQLIIIDKMLADLNQYSEFTIALIDEIVPDTSAIHGMMSKKYKMHKNTPKRRPDTIAEETLPPNSFLPLAQKGLSRKRHRTKNGDNENNIVENTNKKQCYGITPAKFDEK